MNCKNLVSSLLLMLCVLLTFAAPPLPKTAAAPEMASSAPLALAGLVDVESPPGSMIIRCEGFQCHRYHELVYWGHDSKIHFLRVGSLTPTATPLETSLRPSSLGNEAYLFYDRTYQQVYAIDKVAIGAYPDTWHRLEARILRGYGFAASVPINVDFNTPTPVDRYYPIDGAALQQPHITTGSVAKIFADNPVNGNVDIVTFHGHAPEAAQVARISYREPLACAGNPNYCSSQTNPGSSLAVDADNTIYIADNNDSVDRIVVRRHDGGVRPNIDNVGALFDCFVNEAGIGMAPQEEILYLPAGCQSFTKGAVAQLDITGKTPHHVIDLPYYDQGMLVDWYDQKRVFIATTDFNGNYDPDRYLYLHLLYDGQRIATLPVTTDYERRSLGAMTFDPYTNLLYLAVEARIYVVKVNYGGTASFPPLPEGELVLTPGLAAALIATDSSAIFHFVDDTVSQSTRVEYQELPPNSAPEPQLLTAAGAAMAYHTVRQFELTAVINDTDAPFTTFEATYHLEVHYSPQEIAAIIGGKNNIQLYRWSGSDWEQVGFTSASSSANLLNIYTNLTGRFAIRGPTNRVYIPLVLR